MLFRIFAVKNFDDFCKLYQQNKEEMNGDLLAITSKHIVSLISPRDYRISFDNANILLAGLSALNFATLSEKSTNLSTQPLLASSPSCAP